MREDLALESALNFERSEIGQTGSDVSNERPWFDTRFAIGQHHRRVRERFAGNIANDVPLRTEVRDQYRRTKFILGLRGQF